MSGRTSDGGAGVLNRGGRDGFVVAFNGVVRTDLRPSAATARALPGEALALVGAPGDDVAQDLREQASQAVGEEAM